jgi:hypothetical protein
MAVAFIFAASALEISGEIARSSAAITKNAGLIFQAAEVTFACKHATYGDSYPAFLRPAIEAPVWVRLALNEGLGTKRNRVPRSGRAPAYFLRNDLRSWVLA